MNVSSSDQTRPLLLPAAPPESRPVIDRRWCPCPDCAGYRGRECTKCLGDGGWYHDDVPTVIAPPVPCRTTPPGEEAAR